MDRNERSEDLGVAFQMAHRSLQAGLWTAIPGIVVSFNPVPMTCEIQPAVMGSIRSRVDGSVTPVNLPVLLDCPVLFAGGGGATLTFAIQPGDECLVVFSSRCIDEWWMAGEPMPQRIVRMHDMSDGFAIFGPRSLPNVLPDISPTAVQLRSDDGLTYLELDPISQEVNIVAGNINLSALGSVQIKSASLNTVHIESAGSINLAAPNVNASGHVRDALGSMHEIRTQLAQQTFTTHQLRSIRAVGSLLTEHNVSTLAALTSNTAPTVSGFGTGASVLNSNGTTAFTIDVGTANAGSTGTIHLPTAPHGWVCHIQNVTQPATSRVGQTGGTTNTATVTNYSRSSGSATTWTNSDILQGSCFAY